MFKNIAFLLFFLTALIGCGGTEQVVTDENCATTDFFHETILEGVQSANRLRIRDYDTWGEGFLGFKEGKPSLENIQWGSKRELNSEYFTRCQIESCKKGFSLYDNIFFNSGYSRICIPDPGLCQKVKQVNPSGFDFSMLKSEPLSSFFNLEKKDVAECNTPFSCAIGFAINSSNPDKLSCTSEVIDCSSEDLGPGGQLGTKIWNNETNQYESCTISTCKEDYSLTANVCVKNENPNDPVLGCLDERAANYNPLATETDMSCMCEEGILPYNPITGCDEAHFP